MIFIVECQSDYYLSITTYLKRPYEVIKTKFNYIFHFIFRSYNYIFIPNNRDVKGNTKIKIRINAIANLLLLLLIF